MRSSLFSVSALAVSNEDTHIVGSQHGDLPLTEDTARLEFLRIPSCQTSRLAIPRVSSTDAQRSAAARSVKRNSSSP